MMSSSVESSSASVYEKEALIQESHEDPMGVSRRRRRLATGVSLLIAGAVAAVFIRRAFEPCTVVAPLPGDGVVSLAEVQHEEDLAYIIGDSDDRDALRQWLVATTEAGEAAEAAQAAADMPEGPAGVPNGVVRQAMEAESPEQARKVVKRVMGKAMARWQTKRRGLKKYLKENKRSLKLRHKRNPQEQAAVAECVFNVLQASDQVAALAANIKDASETCTEASSPSRPSGKVCAVNIGAIFFSISTIAGALSLAAQNCADTFSTNVGALCAGAVSGIVANVAQLSSMSALVSATCDPKNIDKITPGHVPHNFGRPVHDRRLGKDNSTEKQARRLTFGGGIEADATQCVIDATSIAWWLAQAGLAINSAANPDAAGSCHLFHNIQHVKGNAFRYSQALCTVDVAGALFAFGQAIEYLQLAATHCTDQLNLRAMCGAGVDGIVSSFAGFATSGSAVWTACKEYQSPKAKAALTAAGISNKLSGGKFPLDALGDAGNFGRRLSIEANVAALQERFSSPEEAWKSIGYDMSDQDADFRKVLPPRPSVDEIASLVEEPVAAQDSSAREGLFGSSRTCS